APVEDQAAAGHVRRRGANGRAVDRDQLGVDVPARDIGGAAAERIGVGHRDAGFAERTRRAGHHHREAAVAGGRGLGLADVAAGGRDHGGAGHHHAHGLQVFELGQSIGRIGQFQRQRHRRGQGMAGRERDHAGVDQLGQRQLVRIGGGDVFVDRALHQHPAAGRRGPRRGGGGEHENAFGGGRIAVVLAVGRLQEEAVVLAAGDDAGGGDRQAVVGRDLAAALDGGDRDRGHVVVEDRAQAGGIGQLGAGGVGQFDGEGLVRLGGGVANHVHRDRDRGRTLGDGGGAAAGDVVAVGSRAAVGGGVVHA